MKTLRQACKPRQSVFDRSKQDTALDLKKLLDGRIDPEVFFKENYVTKGMQSLLEGAFQRFTGFSDNGIFLLKQSMGGGKTHSMIALGLLSKYSEIRNAVLGSLYKVNFGAVRVVGFTGRESDSPLGVWGAIAEQLGDLGFGSSLTRTSLYAIREVVATEDAQKGKMLLRSEIKDYWNQRKLIIEILKYLGTMEYKIPHWQQDAKAAMLLAGAVENDNV